MMDAETTDSLPEQPINGAELLDRTQAWFGRFIRVTDDDDLALLTLWSAHTHLVNELFTTPRLLIDSVVPSSGKTTVLDHLNRLCVHTVQAAHLSSAALPRLLEGGMRTILLDEADRMLSPNRPGVSDLLAILNSGYRSGATRPVMVQAGGDWRFREMSTYAPVAIAGNSPELPADTVSRSIRILLLPDYEGTVADSDWEIINDEANQLGLDIAAWAGSVRGQLKGLRVELPGKCIGRSKEKWRPLKRVAVAAGGQWPGLVDKLIAKSLAEDEAERDAGLRALPPGMVLLSDVHTVWPESESFVPTHDLVVRVILHNPGYWGPSSPYGKSLTQQRLGRLLSQSAKVTSSRPGGGGTPRGYLRSELEPVWRRLGIRQDESGQTGHSGETGQTIASRWEDRLHRLSDIPLGATTQAGQAR
jgi:Protein of unknown function (DUF3631)